MASVNSFPRTFKQNDEEFAEGPEFDSNEMKLVNSDYNKVFELSPQRGQGVLLGRGTSNNPMFAEGYISMHLMDNTSTTAVQIFGSVRITVRNNRGRLVKVLYENDLKTLESRDSSGNKKDRENLVPFPVTDDEVTAFDYSVWLEVKPQSDVTIDTAPDSEQTELFVEGTGYERVD